MKLENKITIEKPIEEVWDVLAVKFDKVSEWLSQVNAAHKITDQQIVDDAPMCGRICELSPKENGIAVEERIIYFNEGNHEFHLKVTPTRGKMPINGNLAIFKMTQIENNATEVTINSDVNLKTAGKVLFPVLKLGINKGFNELLEELKYFLENGTPHPRKLKKLKAA